MRLSFLGSCYSVLFLLSAPVLAAEVGTIRMKASLGYGFHEIDSNP